MNYSEEEIKAIKRVEEILKSLKIHKEQLTKDYIYFNQDEDFIIPLQTVLNIIDKQQKEIEYIKDHLKDDLKRYDRHEDREWGQFNRYMQSFYLLKSIRDFEKKQGGIKK